MYKSQKYELGLKNEIQLRQMLDSYYNWRSSCSFDPAEGGLYWHLCNILRGRFSFNEA